jgi:CSLREA domain-containing protein
MLNRALKLALLAAAVSTLCPASLRAELFFVTRYQDKNDGVCGRDCSLREAILAANRHPGFDYIEVPSGTYRLTLSGANEDLGATGDLDITDDVQIAGFGQTATVIDGRGLDRVLDIHAPASVQLLAITIRLGAAPGFKAAGGGIRNSGRLQLYSCVVSGNSAPGFGGGIDSDGPDSSLLLHGSTVSGNSAQDGGGGLAAGGAFTAVNSTISGNRSLSDSGGGIYLFSEAQARFNNVTITSNQAAQRGGGLFAEQPAASGTPRLSNSILAANSAGADTDCLGVDLSGGYNLVGQGEGCPGFSAALGDQTGTAAAPLDPRLARLTDNDGLTPTRALLPGSPALNAANPAAPGSGGDACEEIDQRYRERDRTRCDIGAFERRATR